MHLLKKFQVKRTDGLVEGHAYSVICCREVQLVGGERVHIVKLRNPWGGHEWTGRWSDYDKTRWAKVDRAHSDQGAESDLNTEDGMFWMEYDEFMHIFTTISISRAHMGVERASHRTSTFDMVEARP